MKKILGLDLGTNSIGWALVNEAEDKNEKSSIIRLGVRRVLLTSDEQKYFDIHKGDTPCALRTDKRQARRNLQRFKLRRENLIEILTTHGFITSDTLLSENGNASTFETYRLRAKSATQEISLEQLARVLLMINKKRGYKSSRKAPTADEGELFNGMDIAIKLYEEDLTPGQYVYSTLKDGKKYIPEFYRSDILAELDKVWNFQKQFYPEILTDELREKINGKTDKQTWAILREPFAIVGIKRTTKGFDQKLENYEWRAKSVGEKLGLEELAIVLQKINAQLHNASGYLGAISDRSKVLYFNKQTVGQYKMAQLDANPNYSLKNEVFYRQDYLDEFETIWETQAQFHKELTPELKKEIRDVVIFYQRPLKSQKGQISLCEFESHDIMVEGKKKKVGMRVSPKSSPLFQEFKIWQVINNIQVSEKNNSSAKRPLHQDEKEILFKELNVKEKITSAAALKLLFAKPKELELNYSTLEGNRTQATLIKAYQDIIAMSGNGEYDFAKMDADTTIKTISEIFSGLGWNTDILTFNAELEGDAFTAQPLFQLWHLLYSYEGDNSKVGNESLITKLSELYGFQREYATILAKVSFAADYGSLSTKAMRKIIPFLKAGNEYSVACAYAGYRHSKESLTKEELENKVYKESLELLPHNSLRNPVVEKILNQMINVVNTIISTYGKPDEIRVELARELKKNAEERATLTASINQGTKENEKVMAILKKDFGIAHPSHNDVVRYKLYCELACNGYHTLYSNTYIEKSQLFSKNFDIEHIIPQAKLFDDSFSNKTLEARAVNIEKSDSTAFDYILTKCNDNGEAYKARIHELLAKGAISKAKHDKLLMAEKDIPSDFIDRDLRDSQYIAKKAREILQDVAKYVVSTTGSITKRLREDWQLVDVMQELNWDKYNKLGLTEFITDKDGRQIRKIKDWTKRNDNRHHAMDALTIAFTKRSIIQYLNNLNARSNRSSIIFKIQEKELYRDSKGKLRFNPPMPLDIFRAEAKRHLDEILISTKAKNKVVTQNTNISKSSNGLHRKVQLTPRAQLHNETVYGSRMWYECSEAKVGAAFNEEMISHVARKQYREALMARLNAFDSDPKKAFTGKNSLEKSPIYLDEMHTQCVPSKVKIVQLKQIFTIRKPISADLKIDKVIDPHIRAILQRRLDEFKSKGMEAQAFTNLDENPIWLNEEKHIAIKRVTIRGVANAEPLHNKLDHNGKPILCNENDPIPCDYVSTANNHHIAIFKDSKGNLQEVVVSYFEALARINADVPVIDREYRKSEGWTFMFTLKQNEYFVFPNEETGFDPNEIDLLSPDNYSIISNNLYRVQKMSTKDYVFRHHLETTVTDNSQLKGYTWIRTGLNGIGGIVKVRINHIGQIVSIGEY